VSAGGPAGRRLFFALWPDEAQCRALAAAFGAAVAQAGGRAVPPVSLHLTLEFLGSVPDSELAALTSLGAGLALPDATVVFDRLDWWRRPALLVAAPSSVAPELLAAQARLREALRSRGFRVDTRPFKPHVTLAREVVAAPLAAPATGVTWRGLPLTLVESVATPGGSRYTPLARWPRGAALVDFGAH
jgi:2'-5' RNA ligase